MFRDVFRWRGNRVRITRWDGADGVDRARMRPSAKRYVKWISRVEDHRTYNPAHAFLFRWSCFYGRSATLFIIQIAMLAMLFGLAYADYECPQWFPDPAVRFLCAIDPKVGEVHEGLLDGYTSDWFVPYYYSIVTMTTLGFGDVVPLNLPGRIFVTLEVILGYVYLGAFVTLFASKMVRFGEGS